MHTTMDENGGQTEVQFTGCWSSGVGHVAADSIKDLVLDLRDGIAVEDAHGVVLGVTSTTVVSVNHIQHLSLTTELDACNIT